MATLAYRAFLELDEPSKKPIEHPATSVLNSRPVGSGADHDLQALRMGERFNGPSIPRQNDCQTPSVLEQSMVGGLPVHHESVATLQSWKLPSINKWRFLGACVLSLGNGLNDAVSGALIPSIEESYSIGYAVVSLIFVTQAAGFVLAAPLTHLIDSKLGRARSYMLATTLMTIAYIVLVCRPKYALVVVVYLLNGFGIALNLALNQVWTANLVNSAALLGILHGSYGIGATVAPLIATSMVSNGTPWSFYFFVPMTVQVLCFGCAGWSFRNYEEPVSAQPFTATERQPQPTRRQNPSRAQLLRQAVSEKATLLGSLFIFAYQGSEVSISGWVITFLIKYRDGNPSSVGYVTAGFWAGITVGRFALSHPAHRVGEKTAVVGLTVGATAFQLLVWFVPNVVGNGVALAIVGLLLGPIYPCATVVFSRLLNRNLQMSSLSFISAMGSSGGAVAPFVTGLVAQRVGTWVLHPVCLVLFLTMAISWVSLPRLQRRAE